MAEHYFPKCITCNTFLKFVVQWILRPVIPVQLPVGLDQFKFTLNFFQPWNPVVVTFYGLKRGIVRNGWQRRVPSTFRLKLLVIKGHCVKLKMTDISHDAALMLSIDTNEISQPGTEEVNVLFEGGVYTQCNSRSTCFKPHSLSSGYYGVCVGWL